MRKRKAALAMCEWRQALQFTVIPTHSQLLLSAVGVAALEDKETDV